MCPLHFSAAVAHDSSVCRNYTLDRGIALASARPNEEATGRRSLGFELRGGWNRAANERADPWAFRSGMGSSRPLLCRSRPVAGEDRSVRALDPRIPHFRLRTDGDKAPAASLRRLVSRSRPSSGLDVRLLHERVRTRRGGAGRCSRRSEEHTSELQSPCNIVCRLLLEKKKT